MYKKLFSVRIQLSECTIPVLDNFFEYIKIFNVENEGIILEIFLWYNSKMFESQSKKTLIKMCEDNKITLHDHVIKGNRALIDISTKEHDNSCTFKMYYNDEDTFIAALFQLFSIVKHNFNKEARNENRKYIKDILKSKNDKKR